MPRPVIGRRICVVGNAATGESTLAQALAERLGLRYIDRGALVVGPNWTRAPREELFAVFDSETQHDGWTCDGHLRESRPYEQLVLGRCDTIVWLDFPRWRVMAALIPRTIQRIGTRETLWNDNVENWDVLGWAWQNHARLRREYAALFASPTYATKTLVRLHSRREVNEWLRSLP